MVKKKRSSFQRKDLMQLIRTLCKLANQYSFYFWIEHISTEDNQIADGLSRFTITPQTNQNLLFESAPITLSTVTNILHNI